MSSTSHYILPLADCASALQVGGKAVNLGKLIRAGFPVPGGFVITTDAFRAAQQQPAGVTQVPPDVAELARQAYRSLGRGLVAVRSSATAEDMSHASMAGQYETFLNIESETALIDAIGRCWASLDAPRTRAYLAEHDIDLKQVAMAVVVQKQIPADVAGVLFTLNPNGGADEMLLEASWGLGESVVSGRVQPDELTLANADGRVLNAAIADKQVYLPPGGRDEQPVEATRRRLPCLRSKDVYRLWQLGRRVADHFGSPQDIEWALHAGEIYLIQSRPITTCGSAQQHQALIDATQKILRQQLAAGRGPWALHNLAETLPHPTPLTWSTIQRFMSGNGGFGEMYRQAGFEPSPAVAQEGFLQVIAGRIYMDISRASEMFFADFSFAYDLEALKRSPDASQNPPTIPTGSVMARLRAARKLAVVQDRLSTLADSLDHDIRRELFSEIAAYAATSKPIDLGSLSLKWLRELWQEHEKLVLDTFAPRLLLPSLVSGMAIANLKAFIQEVFWDEDANELAQYLSAGGKPDQTVLANAELYDVGAGKRPLEQWIEKHGHRAAGEFDLAVPRWREQPLVVREMAQRLVGGEHPLQLHQRTVMEVGIRIEKLRTRLGAADRKEFDRHIELVRRYISFREDSKDMLMLGYDLLRDVAREAGRRLDIGDDVFYLTRGELFEALRLGYAPHQLIEQRKRIYQSESDWSPPHVLDCEAVDALGEAHLPAADANGYKAFAVSHGRASGAAKIVTSPAAAGELGRGYVLVCPSTDPSWTPLFVNASALVLECGGTLSHGAVVAREMGLPAVVLPDATRIFKSDEVITVDGRHGWVSRGAADETAAPVQPELSNELIPPQLIPPPPGRRDRRAAKIRNSAALLWSIFLIGFFLLPAPWVHDPALRFMDSILWPLVRGLGKATTVGVVAVLIAVFTLLIQKTLTDNQRLLEAKRRAGTLRRRADLLAASAAGRVEIHNLVASVPMRTFMASLVPIGVLLGPMVLPFIWFAQRVDPSAANAPAGSAVQIVATIDSDWTKPVKIIVPQNVMIDAATPAARSLPPIRPTLEHLLALYRQAGAEGAGLPWELQIAPNSRQQTADDLQAYLNAGIPPQGITWLIRPPEGFSGRLNVMVEAAGNAPANIDVVIGDASSPVIRHPSLAGPIRSLTVVYPRPASEASFLRPFSWINADSGFGQRLERLDLGWVWLYVLVYLPALLLARAILKVA
jgi:pyruvate,water dikinase